LNKKVEEAYVDYFQKMRENNMQSYDAYRLLKNEVKGSPLLKFSEKEAYNSVANKLKRA